MKRLIQLNRYGEELGGIYALQQGEGDNALRLERMKRVMQQAVPELLTSRQQEAVRLYYFENKTVPEIAGLWGVNKSTVSRVLTRAKNHLAQTMKYCMPYM